MKISKLKIQDLQNLLELEHQMYWSSEKWSKIWKDSVKKGFELMLSVYLADYTGWCFGIRDNGELIGAMCLCRVNQVKALPYLHDPINEFDKKGDSAYVSVFVVQKGEKGKKGEDEEDEHKIASALYRYAEKLAADKGCKKLMVVIYSSPVELEVLKNGDYHVDAEKVDWQITPEMMVNCDIWTKSF